MYNDLSAGIALESNAIVVQFLPQRVKIFHDAVMDHGY
jgi:hypothetical protein